jgi:hypothetical protein
VALPVMRYCRALLEVALLVTHDKSLARPFLLNLVGRDATVGC